MPLPGRGRPRRWSRSSVSESGSRSRSSLPSPAVRATAAAHHRTGDAPRARRWRTWVRGAALAARRGSRASAQPTRQPAGGSGQPAGQLLGDGLGERVGADVVIGGHGHHRARRRRRTRRRAPSARTRRAAARARAERDAPPGHGVPVVPRVRALAGAPSRCASRRTSGARPPLPPTTPPSRTSRPTRATSSVRSAMPSPPATNPFEQRSQSTSVMPSGANSRSETKAPTSPTRVSSTRIAVYVLAFAYWKTRPREGRRGTPRRGRASPATPSATRACRCRSSW